MTETSEPLIMMETVGSGIFRQIGRQLESVQEAISLNPTDQEVVDSLGQEATQSEREAYRRGMRAFAIVASALASFFVAACASDGMSCQSGPKYGTQCYNSSQQPMYTSSQRSSGSPQSAPSSPMPASTR